MDDETRHYLDTLAREVRAGFAELRAAMAENRLDQATRHGTLMDSIADLRREYEAHWHPPTDPPSTDN